MRHSVLVGCTFCKRAAALNFMDPTILASEIPDFMFPRPAFNIYKCIEQTMEFCLPGLGKDAGNLTAQELPLPIILAAVLRVQSLSLTDRTVTRTRSFKDLYRHWNV
jgi:hypothetical protein